MKVLVVIVNYRTSTLAVQAVEAALGQLETVGGSIVVVDNDSRDGSYRHIVDAVRERGWGDRVEVIQAPRNGGFGYGNNLAIRRALAADHPPEFIYLLNPDAFPDEGAIVRLVSFLQTHPQAGIVGSFTHGVDGTPHRTAFRFPTVMSEFESGLRLGIVSKLFHRWVVAPPIPEQTTEWDWLSGASLMLRRAVFESSGLFDEDFFLYFEETDLCWRARQQGWSAHYVRESSVAHVGSASTGIQDHERRMPPYWFASRRHYFRKTRGTPYLWAANLAWLLGFSGWRIRRRLQGKPDRDPPHMLRDFLRHNFVPFAGGRTRLAEAGVRK